MRILFRLARLICLLWLASLSHLDADGIHGSTYRLVEGSTLTDDCPVCDRIALIRPLRGSFTLVLHETNPLFSQYELKGVNFEVGSGTNRTYAIAGKGTYQLGGEVAVLQDMTLEGQMNGQPVYFTNTVRTVARLWPVLEIDLVQTNWSSTQALSLHLRAAPFQEIWFSTLRGLTSGNRPSPGNSISSGDLISNSGRTIRSKAELIQALKLKNTPAGLGLDAFDIGAGGEIFFALDQDTISESFGSLQSGDWLSDRGRLVKRNQDLTAAWAIMPPVPDLGLESVQITDQGEMFFAIEKPAFSEVFARTFSPGEIYSTKGQVIRSSGQLYAQFSPKGDYGLKAFYIWPSGEIWFTPAIGFQDPNLGAIQSGDLLSDQGYIVFRNLELVSAFEPLEDVSNFGLNSLFVVTDATPAAQAPHIMTPTPEGQTANVNLRWDGPGKVFQVERADTLDGPYSPASPIMPDLDYLDPGILSAKSSAYYRVRQW